MKITMNLSVSVAIFFTGCGQQDSPETIKAGEALYSKCVECHGIDGKDTALGKSEVIAGQSRDEIASKLYAYKAGKRNVSGMGAWKQGTMVPISDADIEALAAYISTF